MWVALVLSLCAAGAVAFGLLALRLREICGRDTVWAALRSTTVWRDVPFDLDAIEGLPPPARRFFGRAIDQGTPIRTVAIVTLSEVGRWRLFHQLLAVPVGGVSRFRKRGMVPISGFMAQERGKAQARAWMLGVLPWLRFDGEDPSAVAALVIQAVLFVPGSVLPGPGITWRGLSDTRASLDIATPDLHQVVEIEVADDGTLVAVSARNQGAGLLARPRDFGPAQGHVLPHAVTFEGQASPFLPSQARLKDIRYAGPWAGSSHT